MKSVLAILACSLTIVVNTALGWSAERPRHYEKIEWTWTDRPTSPDPTLPNVLLVGDSIARNYEDRVATLLRGEANVYLFLTSASVGDERLPHQIGDYFAMVRTSFAVIHLNNGMHGVDYSEADYRKYYPEFVAAFKRHAPCAKLVVATTTPVRTDVEGFPSNARIDERNATAARWATRLELAIDDQHTLMLHHQDLHSDDVHFAIRGSNVQAAAVAKAVRSQLAARPRATPLQLVR